MHVPTVDVRTWRELINYRSQVIATIYAREALVAYVISGGRLTLKLRAIRV